MKSEIYDSQLTAHGFPVEIKNLDYRYPNGHHALRGVSLEVLKGEAYGLLGPNGCGKTTLFRVLSTLLLPAKGKVFVDGLDVAGECEKVRERLGVVFQSPSVDTKLTVRENLIHQGYVYGLYGRKLKARCDQMMENLGLVDRQRDRVGVLSGGLKRRVELAKGLLHQPAILLLDEPSTGLDPGARRDLWTYLKKLCRETSVTVLVTTHLMEEAENCDRLAIMNEGKVVRSGTPQELKGEVGGDVLVVKSPDAAGLALQVKDKLGLDCRVVDGILQIEHYEGARFVKDLVEDFPGMVESVTFRRPTLEDVFAHYTGHRFWQETAGEKGGGK